MGERSKTNAAWPNNAQFIFEFSYASVIQYKLFRPFATIKNNPLGPAFGRIGLPIPVESFWLREALAKIDLAVDPFI